MSDGLELLRQTGQGYDPLATGTPHPRLSGMEGVPLLGGQGGPYQALAGMAMTPYYQRMLGGVGMIPMGVGHDRNVADTLRHMQFTQMQQAAMRQAAETDRVSFMQTAQGWAAITGTPFGAQQQQAASTLVNGAVLAAPIMASLMPDFYDSFGGLRGSAAVLASRTFDAGRYRIDPITGRLGQSAETSGVMAQRLMNDLYADESIAKMQGVSAGKLGDMLKQFQARGMVAGAESEAGYAGFRPGSPYGEGRRALDHMYGWDRDGLQKAATNAGVKLTKSDDLRNLGAAELDKLMEQPEVQNQMRAIDTHRVKKSLKGYTDAIVAMRDIFGDAGHPNAPMAELVRGLEALTAGSVHKVDPSRLNMMVRDIHNLSRDTGVSMNGVMMMQHHNANRAQQIGVEPIFAMAATNRALAWAGAYRAGGHGAYADWGSMTADQYTQLKGNMVVNAAGSETANRLAVFRRVSGIMQGFEAGSEAAAVDTAIKQGRGTYEWDGKTKGLDLEQQDLVKLLTSAKGPNGTAGVWTERDIHELLMQRKANEEITHRDGLFDIVTQRQVPEISRRVVAPAMNRVLLGDITERLEAQGMSQSDAHKRAVEMSEAVSTQAVDAISKLSTQEFSGGDKHLHIAGKIADELKKSGVADKLGMTKEELERFSMITSHKFHGAATESLKQSHYGMQSVTDWHRMGNDTIDQRRDQTLWQVRLESERQTALSPLGRGTIMQRGFEALRNARPDDEKAWARFMSETLGGVDSQKFGDALQAPMQKAAAMDAEIKTLTEKIQTAKDPQDRQKLEENLNRLQREFRAETAHIAELGAKHGHYAAGGITKDETSRALRADYELRTNQGLLGDAIMEKDDKARREKYDKLWGSSQGVVFRRSADHFIQDMGNVAYRLVASPEMVHRLGEGAVETSKQLTADQDRLHNLALLYSGGDMSRLFAGDVNLPAGPERDEALREVGDIHKRTQETLMDLHETHDKQLDSVKNEYGPGGDRVRSDKEQAEEKERLTKLQAEAHAKLTESGETALRRVYKDFGVKVGDQLTPDQQRTAQMLGGGAGKNFARLASESQETLVKVAEATGRGTGNTGVDNLGFDYQIAMIKARDHKDTSQLEAMRAGIKGASWFEFEKAMQFQMKSELLGFNRAGGANLPTDAAFENIFQKMTQPGNGLGGVGPFNGQGGPQGPVQITGTLKVDLVKGIGEIENGTMGGSRASGG